MTITNLLVAVNIIAYVWLVSTGGLSSDRALIDHGALDGARVIYYGEWWRIVTGAFLHGNLLHIAFNMFALYQVGNIVEVLYGKLRFVLLYAISMLGSGIAVAYFAPGQLTVGASGAIFGLFGALVGVGIRLGPRGRGLIGQVLPVIIINLIFTFTIPNISAAGHVGGLITGFVAGLVLFMVPSRQREYAYAYVAGPNEREPVETIDQPPDAGPHEEAGAPPFRVRDPRE